MKKLSVLLVLAAGMALGASSALAQTAPAAAKSTAKPAAKQTPKKAAPKKNAPAVKKAAPTAVVDEDDQEPDITASTVTPYDCELGNSLTIYQNAGDDSFIALRWKKELRRLKRIPTTTGANRFENRKHGLVWIDIPTKGMLLDSKKGQQLANECRNPEHRRMMADAAK